MQSYLKVLEKYITGLEIYLLNGRIATFVRERIFSGTKVAMKQYLDAWSKADNESVHLLCSDEHPKDITYYDPEICSLFIHLSMQISQSNIEGFVENSFVK
jgi:hypothetical protein